jgi:hypothetical protein
VNVSAERYKKRGCFLLFSSTSKYEDDSTVDYGVLGTLKDHNTLVLFRSFDRFASYISSSPF